ncbi:MAG: TetR/AcrR family transcriptional regulator [Flavobacteriaceae bacterium]|nr:TetR/AcrR family transcriptional regulator [Flavobacteriaceae bacterium]
MIDLNINITINSVLYTKDPDSSDLGRNIITYSIELINEIGFEKFTFKKLSQKINSPESSVYRYFNNKHMLLIYLTSWYWSWTVYKIALATLNIKSSEEKLKNAIDILTKPILIDNSFSYVNEVLLNKIIITESVKAYHSIDVDIENKKGYFESYKDVINRVSTLILEVNPTFEYPHMLITTVIEGAQQQHYYSEHLPSLTDTKKNKDSISNFYNKLIFKLIS